jgi:hypothetical protein
MRALGQSSIQVAMRYADASPRRAAERVAALAPIGPVKAGKVIPISAARKDPVRTQEGTAESVAAKAEGFQSRCRDLNPN